MQHVIGSGGDDYDDDGDGDDGDLRATNTKELNNSVSSPWTWCNIRYVALAKLAHHINLSKFWSWLQFCKMNIWFVFRFAYEALAEADDINWSSTQQLAGQASRVAAELPSLPSLRSGKYCHYSSFQLEEVEQTVMVEERRVTC